MVVVVVVVAVFVADADVFVVAAAMVVDIIMYWIFHRSNYYYFELLYQKVRRKVTVSSKQSRIVLLFDISQFTIIINRAEKVKVRFLAKYCREN